MLRNPAPLSEKAARTGGIYGEQWHFTTKRKNAKDSPTKRQRVLFKKLTKLNLPEGAKKGEAEELIREAVSNKLAGLQNKSNGKP